MQSETPQTLLIVDDHPLFRKGVIQLIMAVPEFRFIGEAPSGREPQSEALLPLFRQPPEGKSPAAPIR